MSDTCLHNVFASYAGTLIATATAAAVAIIQRYATTAKQRNQTVLQ